LRPVYRGCAVRPFGLEIASPALKQAHAGANAGYALRRGAAPIRPVIDDPLILDAGEASEASTERRPVLALELAN